MKQNTGARVLSLTLRFLVIASAVFTTLIIVFLIGYILVRGIPNLSTDLFSPRYSSENVSLFPALVNTIIITIAALLAAVTVGIC